MTCLRRLPPVALLLAAGWPAAGLAQLPDIDASPPAARAVTVYRAPVTGGRSRLALDRLAGFALVTETRTVSLPAGESRLRFLGVADGIQSASALLTGLPSGVIEKNRDAAVLSPDALLAATLGRPVTLVRSNPTTGRETRITGTLRAGGGSTAGVVFESSAGIEALRCSGLPETFEFSGTAGLSPTPTLSVKVRSPKALTAQVSLTYLARGFDWAATYTATLSADAHTLDLGAWVTLANSNGVSFPQASVAVVAGRLNRVNGQVEPLDLGAPILAQCWPMGRTSDIPEEERPAAMMFEAYAGEAPRIMRALAAPAPPGGARKAMAPHVEEEQLGDLKLYRVPERTSLQARQMKQVRLLDRESVPVELLHIARLTAGEETTLAATRVLRTRNDAAHHLGLPLPSGAVSTYTPEGDTPLLLEESPLRDIAVNEDVEIGAGEAADVQVRAVNESRTAPAQVELIPLLPGVQLRTGMARQVSRIDVANARAAPIVFEARLALDGDIQLVRSTVPPVLRDGRQVLRVRVPAGGRLTIRYQTEHRVAKLVRPR